MKLILNVVVILVCAVGLEHSANAQDTQFSDEDRLKIAVQAICPVSGEELGSMGNPVKVRAGSQVAFLCCKACQGNKIDPEHWAKIQVRLATAQATCPIMGKPVDAKMESTVVEGQKVFVCCPPCIEKIESEPATALRKVRSAYKRFVEEERRTRSDRLHAIAQKICPVSGEPLGSKGDPVKVKVGKHEHAFLCCQECTGGKLSAEHWKTIQRNLAKAQGTCPVMEKPVDETMSFAIVNGRKIFVCCPPCIEKIEKDPEDFVAKLDRQITKTQRAESLR
ncbi:MAG: hypothetical protein AAFU85_03565 [Planctomycetota bacterium]